jgi:hypothetical protein
MGLTKKIRFGDDPAHDGIRKAWRAAVAGERISTFAFSIRTKPKSRFGWGPNWDPFWPAAVSAALKERGVEAIVVNGRYRGWTSDQVRAIRAHGEIRGPPRAKGTQHDVRAFMLGLPEGVQLRQSWQKAAELLLAAAEGDGDIEAANSGRAAPFPAARPTVEFLESSERASRPSRSFSSLPYLALHSMQLGTRQTELALFLEAKLVLSRERAHPPK